jgi:phage-related baseplate assembly protein
MSNFLKYNMGRNVAYGSITLTHSGDTIEWDYVESFWRSRASDYHYTTELFADDFNGEQDTVFLVVGDGSKGHSVPETGMHLTYIRTDGSLGNSGSGVVTIYPNAYTNVIEVTNVVSATGGSDAEAHEVFRERVPAVTRAQRRAVTPEDYEALVTSIPGVADCQAVDRNLLPTYPWEFVALYVLPEGGGVTPPILLTEIRTQLQEWGHLNSWSGRYLIRDATTKSIDVTARLNSAPGYLAESVRVAVIAAISNRFVLPNVSIGANFSFTSLNVDCNRVEGVNWIEFDTPKEEVSITYGEIPTVGIITVTLVA